MNHINWGPLPSDFKVDSVNQKQQRGSLWVPILGAFALAGPKMVQLIISASP